MSNKKTKQVAVIRDSSKKETKQNINPGHFDSLYPSWRFYRADELGKWSIKRDDWKVFDKEVYPKLKDFEKKTWAEIKSEPKSRGNGSKHHNIEIWKFSNEVKKLLMK